MFGHPPVVSRTFSFNSFLFQFTAAHAQIHGESAVYVKIGSTISLTCTINLYSVPPPDITWYHGSKVRGDILVSVKNTKSLESHALQGFNIFHYYGPNFEIRLSFKFYHQGASISIGHF